VAASLNKFRVKWPSESKKFRSTFSIGKTLKEWKPSLAMAAYSGLKSKDELASLDNLFSFSYMLLKSLKGRLTCLTNI
jgi:hypothetical protein